MTKHIAATFLQACDDLAAQCDALCHERGLMHRAHDAWPVAPDVDGMELGEPVGSTVRHGRVETLHTIGDVGLVSVVAADGGVTVRTHAASPVAAAEALAQVREVIPRGSNPNPNLVPVSFWTYSPHGPQRIRRDVDADAWPSITTNYTPQTAEAVGRLIDPAFRPGVGGQLVLWHGDAGTGKTTALRALAREWREWCEMHYIVDPDQFFGKHADYMMRVLLGGDTDPMAEMMRARRGLVTTSQPPPWRLLILEDCGEMLQPDARREIGQALSRFLNACDGLIGRGLRVLVLVTTNEPLDKLHDAVSRPGRCAARVEFERFGANEARAWLAERDGRKAVPGGGLTLAELFGMIAGFQDAGDQRRSIGSPPDGRSEGPAARAPAGSEPCGLSLRRRARYPDRRLRQRSLETLARRAYVLSLSRPARRPRPDRSARLTALEVRQWDGRRVGAPVRRRAEGPDADVASTSATLPARRSE